MLVWFIWLAYWHVINFSLAELFSVEMFSMFSNGCKQTLVLFFSWSNLKKKILSIYLGIMTVTLLQKMWRNFHSKMFHSGFFLPPKWQPVMKKTQNQLAKHTWPLWSVMNFHLDKNDKFCHSLCFITFSPHAASWFMHKGFLHGWAFRFAAQLGYGLCYWSL